jgi:hypothetical protein
MGGYHKIYFEEMEESGLNSFVSEYGQVVSFFEHGNRLSSLTAVSFSRKLYHLICWLRAVFL